MTSPVGKRACAFALPRVELWLATALAIVTLVFAGPVQCWLSAHLAPLDGAAVEERATSLGPSTLTRRPTVDPDSHALERAETAACDTAEESEAESFATGAPGWPVRLSFIATDREARRHGSGASFGFTPWVRDQHAPRGPPQA